MTSVMWMLRIFDSGHTFSPHIGSILFGDAFEKLARRFPSKFSVQIAKAIIKRAVRASAMLPLGGSGGSGVHAG